MSRPRHVLVAIGAAATLAAAAALPALATARSASGTRIELRRTSLGRILTDARGFTLYVFSRDRRNQDRCVTRSGCVSVWPVVRTSAAPVAGPGVRRSLLGSIRLRGGVRQVTYDGRPLYRYSADSGPRQTSYVGASQFGGVWRALRASGSTVG